MKKNDNEKKSKRRKAKDRKSQRKRGQMRYGLKERQMVTVMPGTYIEWDVPCAIFSFGKPLRGKVIVTGLNSVLVKFIVSKNNTAHDVGFVVSYDRIKESKVKIRKEVLTSGEKYALEFVDEFFKYPYANKVQIKPNEKGKKKKWREKIMQIRRLYAKQKE